MHRTAAGLCRSHRPNHGSAKSCKSELARRTTDLGAQGDGCHRGRVSTTRARGHRSIHPSAPDDTTQTGTAAGRCRRHFGQGSGRRGEEQGEHGEPSIWWLRKQPGPGGVCLAGAAAQAARTTRPTGRTEDAARSTPGACAHPHAHPSSRDLAAPQLPWAVPGAPSTAALLEPETSLLRPASRSRAGPPGPGSPQNRPSLLLSSSPLLIYPPLSVPSEQPSAPLLSPRSRFLPAHQRASRSFSHFSFLNFPLPPSPHSPSPSHPPYKASSHHRRPPRRSGARIPTLDDAPPDLLHHFLLPRGRTKRCPCCREGRGWSG